MTVQELTAEIDDKLKDLYRISDHYVPISAQGRFSEYDSAKEAIQELADMFIAQQEDIEKYEELQTKYHKLQEAIAEVSSDLEDVVEIDTEVTDGQGNVIISSGIADSINTDVNDAIKQLDKLSDADWEYEYPKTKQKRK